MLDIIGKRFRFFLLSGAVILVCIISLAAFGLKIGVEFSSGSVMTVGFTQKVDQSELKKELASLGYGNALIQRFGEDKFLIRLPELSGEKKAALETGLSERLGSLQVGEFDAVSPMVATETTRNAVIAVIVASFGILLYIAWAFRKMPNPFRYGTSAIIALLHDVLIAVGVFSLLGGILGWEIDLMFLTGVLTVIGYSINDTVVIFDRIRENVSRNPGVDFEAVVNRSLVETMSRSLNTSLTTLFVVLALLLFVGTPIRNFAVVLLVGIVPGTYSSICIAPPLLVVWQKKEWGRFIGRKSLSSGQAEDR